MFHKPFLPIALLALLCGIPSFALINGEKTEPGEYPAVFRMAYERPSPVLGSTAKVPGACTAVLLAPTLLVGDAHCIGHAIHCPAGSPDEQPCYMDYSIQSVANGHHQLKSYGLSVNAKEWKRVRKYRENRGVNDVVGLTTILKNTAYDVAYAVLKEPAPVEPLEVYPDLDPKTLESLRGSPLTFVGYGGSYYSATDFDSYGGTFRKRKAQRPLEIVADDYLLFVGKESGVTVGDSGGPVLIERDGKNYVIGLASRIITAASKDKYEGFTSTRFRNELLCDIERESGVDIPSFKCRD